MYRLELEVDEQSNIQKELNANISMISVQYNSWYRPKQEVYQVTWSANFAPPAINQLCVQDTKAKSINFY